MKISKSTQDYLESILMIQQEKGLCRMIDVATHLQFSKPSVSIAMKHLEEEGYVQRGAEGQLLLTAAGEEVARATLDRHRFMTRLFIEIGVDPAVAEEDACGIEHSISQETFDRLREAVESGRLQITQDSAEAAPQPE